MRGVICWRGVWECVVDLADYAIVGAAYLVKRALIAFAVTAGGASWLKRKRGWNEDCVYIVNAEPAVLRREVEW